METQGVEYVHTISEAGRLLPSSSRWNSIELDFNLFPKSSTGFEFDSLPSQFSKSVDYNLIVSDKKYLKRFIFISVSFVIAVISLSLLLRFLPRKHKHHGSSKNLTLALNQALLFFDAQKSGYFPKNGLIKFRGNSGLQDGNTDSVKTDLVGGFYDSGNNIKFSFSTAYTITLLSWTVIEYHEKYLDIGELDHVKDILKWGTDYLLKVFVPPNNTTNRATLYSQVGIGSSDDDNDVSCWQRPEDMRYPRPVSVCGSRASDLAGEIVAALSAASLVFKQDRDFSGKLVKAAEELFEAAATRVDPSQQGTFTAFDDCGGQARQFYNSSSYKDELVWGGTWLFFATGNNSYLGYATQNFGPAQEEEIHSEKFKGAFYWNNKLIANAVLLTRLRFFRDLGYPYEDAFGTSSTRTDNLMCSYLSDLDFNKTKGGLILLKPSEPLQYAVTASFLSKLYSDYLQLLSKSGSRCSACAFLLDDLREFSESQVGYILGDNPMKMSYVVGFGNQYPKQVHHRAASIPWDGQPHSCAEGGRWLQSKEANPNNIVGAMVGGPDQDDIFVDQRDKPWFTEPSLASNAGLVAALVALHRPPTSKSSDHSNGVNLGIDKLGMFENINFR